jgi:hypothetical protein
VFSCVLSGPIEVDGIKFASVTFVFSAKTGLLSAMALADSTPALLTRLTSLVAASVAAPPITVLDASQGIERKRWVGSGEQVRIAVRDGGMKGGMLVLDRQ